MRRNILVFVIPQSMTRECTGVGTFVKGALRGLAYAGREVALAASAKDYARSFGLLDERTQALPAVTFKKSWRLEQELWALNRGVKAAELWPPTDVIYCPFETVVSTGGMPLVVSIYDVAQLELGLRHEAGFARRYAAKYVRLRLAERRADYIHTPSSFSAERIAHMFPRLESRIRIIPGGVDVRLPRVGDDRCPAERDPNLVMLPGGLSYRKNGDLIRRVWQMVHVAVPRAQLVVTGPVFAEYQDVLELPGVVYRGFVREADLACLYQRAGLVWYPSRYEGFGFPVLEAMASGAPLLASRAGAIPEVAGSAAVLAAPESAEAHSDVIIQHLRGGFDWRDVLAAGPLQLARFSCEAFGAAFGALVDS